MNSYKSSIMLFPNKKAHIAWCRMMSAGGENKALWNHYEALYEKYSKTLEKTKSHEKEN